MGCCGTGRSSQAPVLTTDPFAVRLPNGTIMSFWSYDAAVRVAAQYGGLIVGDEPAPVAPAPVEPEAVEPEAIEPEAVEPEAIEPEAIEPAKPKRARKK